MADDDTDELPAVTEAILPVDPDQGGHDGTTLRQPPADLASGPGTPAPPAPPRPPRFAGARRHALLWNAGYGIVSGLVILVLWASDRPIDSFPDWSTLVVGVAVVLWAGILTAIAAGGVGRTATALVGLVNLLVGGGALLFGWFTLDVPALAVVVAAQVVAFGVAQLVASVRR